MPQTSDEWKEIAKGFELRWNFPNCLGAMDGKHVNIKCPAKSGSFFYNYKGQFSIVLLAVVDAEYKFIYIDVGTNGRVSDGGVYRDSPIASALATNSVNIPVPRVMSDGKTTLPYVLVADEAFPLKNYLMKPYAARNLTRNERIYNYRLSRARRTVENAFGILASRFRVLLTTIQLAVQNIEPVVQASCVLHNFLRSKSQIYLPAGALDAERADGSLSQGSWREDGGLHSIGRQSTNTYSFEAKEARETFCKYFNESGRVDWQDGRI